MIFKKYVKNFQKNKMLLFEKLFQIKQNNRLNKIKKIKNSNFKWRI